MDILGESQGHLRNLTSQTRPYKTTVIHQCCWTAILAESRFQIGACWIHLRPVGAISHRFMDLVRLALLVDLSAHLPEELRSPRRKPAA